MREMIREHFKPEDYFYVRDHMIGTGMIGGKACGMLLARKIIENTRPDLYDLMEPHDSWFIGSDVYYSYIVENGFWDLRVRQRTEEEYFSLAETFSQKLLSGRFSGNMEKRFSFLLEYYGQDPIIVRSSSILEDGFGNAFAGKYESVFCANTGTLEERLHEFENAIRRVYASSMSLSALDYRKRRNLAGRDEQMALPLVKAFLSESGMTKAQIDRVAFLVGHHHTFKEIDGLDWQILIEADYIANATENGYSRENVKSFIQKIMKTGSGIRLAQAVFCL
jgi:hypothetical protein